MFSMGKSLILGFLLLVLALSQGAALAITADELLKQLEEERVLTPEKAAKIREKGKEVDKKEAVKKWIVKCDNGLKIQSGDGQNEIGIGGRLHIDFANISSPTRGS